VTFHTASTHCRPLELQIETFVHFPWDQWVTVCTRYDRNSREKRLIGYARVSTCGQTLDSQLDQLRAAGYSRNIYRETVTGVRPDRRELNRMLGKLAPWRCGDRDAHRPAGAQHL
jgi:hypothetical protein